jgi:hypothetical protein
MPLSNVDDPKLWLMPIGCIFDRLKNFRNGARCTTLGTGVRIKRFALAPFKVYAFSLYVDSNLALPFLKSACKASDGDESIAAALLTPGPEAGFTRAVQVQLVRSITGKQFVEALDETVKPAMHHDPQTLDDFYTFFQSRRLDAGDGFVLLWSPEVKGALHVLVGPSASLPDLSKVTPDAVFPSDDLARALFTNYLGPRPINAKAKAAFIEGARTLMSK